MEGCGGRVQVFARVRPPGFNEDAGANAVAVDDALGYVKVRDDAEAVERIINGQKGDVTTLSEAKEYSFDAVFPQNSTQRDVFQKVGVPVLRECMKGFNGTILAYGQTGSGKTFSLLHQGQKGEEAGLLPRLIASLFLQIAQDGANVYTVEAAAVQVYNEQIDDLLHPDHQSGEGCNLAVQNGGHVPGTTWIECRKPEAMLDAFTRARANVVYAETKMNKASSRSHAVFQVRISKRLRATAPAGSGQRFECTHARLNVVDLAGSERVKKSGAEGTQFKEATNINRSLLSFGNVVSALAAKKAHVPLRDSKLTRILDGSIGGNCKTALLVCASPAMVHASETINTFEFASRAMRVEVDAKVNTSIVEVSAKDLLADLSCDAELLSGIPLGAELDSLRRKSNAAAEQAKKEKEKREKAIAEAKKSQQLAESAEQNGRRWQEENVQLRQSQEEVKCEADRLRRTAEKAERTAKEWQESAAEKAKEADRLRAAVASAEKTAQEWRAAAEARSEEAQLAKSEVLVVKEKVKVEVAAQRNSEELAKMREEMTTTTKQAETRTKAAEDRAARADGKAATAQAAADEAEERAKQAEARAESSALEVAVLQDKLGSVEEQLCLAKAMAETTAMASDEKLAAERTQAADALRAAATEAEELRAQTDEALRRNAELEKEVQAQCEELAAREAIIEEARAELERVRAAAGEREAQLREEFDGNLQAVHEAHCSEAEAYRAEITQMQLLATGSLEEARIRHMVVVEELEQRLEGQTAQWAEERSEMEVAHSAELEAQRAALEQRLEEGKRDFEQRLAEATRASEEQLQELQSKLEEQEAHFEATRQQMEASKETAIREAWEEGNSQQRRLAAAFKAARSITYAKEQETRQAHADLAKRFASRESREDDVAEIEKQRRLIEEKQRALRHREGDVRALCLELQNRDDTDRIFSEPEMRRYKQMHQRGFGPAMPGKKVGDIRNYPDRDSNRRARSMPRPFSASMATSSSGGLAATTSTLVRVS